LLKKPVNAELFSGKRQDRAGVLKPYVFVRPYTQAA